MINLNEAITKIRKAGINNVRYVPIAGSNINGDYQIEIFENNTWNIIISNIPRTTAEDLVTQATNKVLLG